jgi:hypothetical protein
MQMTFIKKCFLFMVGRICYVAVHSRVEKFPQGCSIVADDTQPGHSIRVTTDVPVQWVEELIRADRRITIDNSAI